MTSFLKTELLLLKTKLKFMRSKIKYITVLGITLLIACSSTQKKNTQEDDSVVETVVNEDAFTSSKKNMLEKDNPFEIEILRYSTVELKQRIGKADPENIRDLFLLLPDRFAFEFSVDERKQMLDGKKVGGGLEMDIGDLDLKNQYLNFQGNYTGNWEMCANRESDLWLFAVNYTECGEYCSTMYAKMFSYRNGVIKELKYANLAGYQDLWPELFFDYSKLTKEQIEFIEQEWSKLTSLDFNLRVMYNLPKDGKTIEMYIDNGFFEEMPLPYEAFKLVETDMWE